MAAIKTAIQIVDGMTPALKSMTTALNIVTNSFEALQNTSGKAIDTASITAARKELAAANVHINNMENDLRQSAAAQEALNNKMKEGNSFAGGLVGKLAGMAAAYASWQSVMGLVTATDEYTGISSRLDMINDGLQTTKELQEMVRASANSTYSNYKDTADMVGKLGIQAGDAFANNQDILNFAEQINKHLAIAGTSGAAAQGAMIQLTQAMSNGVLRGEELNSVMDGMPTVAKTIEKYFNEMGDTRGIKQIAEDGLITADIVKRALYSAADETDAKFKSMGVTFAGVWNLFKNSTDKAMTPVYEKLKELTGSKDFQNFAVMAGNAIATVAGVMVWAFDLLASIGSFAAQNWDLIAPVIGGVTAAFVAYNAALLINWMRQKMATLWTGALAIATQLKSAATWGEFKASMAAAAAQWGLNAAILACPLTWIVLAIIAVIGVLYLAVAAVNHFAGTSISATGIIARVFGVLGTSIYNIVAYIYNAFASFVEFIANAFTDPVYSIKALFVNLATNFLDAVIAMAKGWDEFATSMANAMIDAVNMAVGAWNKLMDMLPDGVKSTLGLGKGETFNQRTSIVSDLEGAKATLQGWLGEPPADYWTAPKMEQKGLGDAWNASYNWGSNLTSGTSGLAKAASGATAAGAGSSSADMMRNAGLSGTANKIAQNTAKTAGNTANLSDSLTGTEEELKYMRDIAVREAINRFTTAEIKVDMTNNNTISNGLDIDGVIGQLAGGLREAMEVAAEGVHI